MALPHDRQMNLEEFGLDDVQDSATKGGVRLISATFPAGRHDQVWRALRQAHGRTGLWPVLSWDARRAASDTYGWQQPQGHDALADALAIDPSERMAVLTHAAYESCVEDYDPDDHEGLAPWRDAFDADLLARRLAPVTTPPPGIRRVEKQSRLTEVLLVPAAAGYEVPVLVPGLPNPSNWFGGPSHQLLTLADHLAVLRHWERQHEAELYFAYGSRLELAVGKPPREPREVAQCAIEQMSYCSDLTQFIGDEESVARHQVPADRWSFWWD